MPRVLLQHGQTALVPFLLDRAFTSTVCAQVRVSFFEWLDERSPENAEAEENTSEHDDYSNPDEHVVPVKKKETSKVLLALCCGINSYHWWIDTAAGLFASTVFSVATAALLSHDDIIYPAIGSNTTK